MLIVRVVRTGRETFLADYLVEVDSIQKAKRFKSPRAADLARMNYNATKNHDGAILYVESTNSVCLECGGYHSGLMCPTEIK